MYLFHPHQLPSAELHDYLVHLRALAQSLDTGSYGIGIDLLYCLRPLLLGCLFCVVGLRQVFQFEDIAVVCLVVGHVGQEEEVAVAMVELHIGGSDVVVVETEIGKEEALDVALALDGVAH